MDGKRHFLTRWTMHLDGFINSPHPSRQSASALFLGMMLAIDTKQKSMLIERRYMRRLRGATAYTMSQMLNGVRLIKNVPEREH